MSLPQRAASPSARPAPPVPAGGLVTANAPPLRLPGEHFAAAITFLALGTLCLAFIAPLLATGTFFAPHVAAVVHLFTIGFISISIFGALYQFLPVAVGTPIKSQRLAHVAFVLLAIGLPVFVVALAESVSTFIPIGGTMLALAFTLVAGNVIATLATSSDRSVTWWALSAASVFLVATMGFGLFLAFDVATGVAGALRFDLLLVHVHVALAGWVLMVMIGVGHRLLPMFMLSHGASERPAQLAVASLSGGCILLMMPLGTPVRILAGVLIALGVVAFLVQAALFYRHRKKGTLDPAMRLAMMGLAGLGVALLLAPIAFARGWEDVQLMTTYIFVVIVGGISLFIAGHYFKIVSFVVWYHRFGPLVGKKRVPRVADLYSARAVQAVLVLLVAGVGVVAGGILAGSALTIRVGALALTCGVILEGREMLRIARAHAV
jgi:hypothetical protein